MKSSARRPIHAALGRTGTVLATALLLAAPPAQAYFLQTTVNSNTSFHTYNSDTGVGLVGGSSGGTSAPGASVATSFASFADPNYSSAGQARAALRTGSLHASNTTDGFFGDSQAGARLNDTLRFDAPAAAQSDLITITIDLHLTGSISQLSNFSYLYGFSISGQGGGVSVGWQATYFDLDDPRNGFGWAGTGGYGSPAGFDAWELVAGTVDEFHLRGTVSFTGTQSPEYLLQTVLSVRCAGGTDCDFGQSAYFDFELPAGVSFTSGSRLLLVGDTPPVPLPPTAALLLAGLGGIGWMSRRRRR